MSQNIDYAENLFEAIKTISQKQLEGLHFDITIEATIIDDSKAQEGVYLVSSNNYNNFTAYSSNKDYKKNDVVMIIIPQGDYNNQKTIIEKKKKENDEIPITYKSPFSQLINISNNIIDSNKIIKLKANDDAFLWSEEYEQFVNSIDNNYQNLIWTTDENLIEQKELQNVVETKQKNLLKDFNSGFSQIGIKADFSTSLKNYNIISGNYGLALIVTFYDINSNNTFYKPFIFDSKDFFGDIYNFETYYTQEALFNISEFQNYTIKNMYLFAYQRKNFKNINNTLINFDENKNSNLFDEEYNIFIKNLYICLGEDITNFNQDTVKIITSSSSNYSANEQLENNKKTLKLQWIHRDEITNNISLIQNEMPTEEYEIRWYKYKLGSPSPDEFIDAHWVRFYGSKNIANQNGDYDISLDENNDNFNQYNNKFENYIEYIEENHSQEEIEEYWSQNFNFPLNVLTNNFSIDFYPNIKNNKEQLRAIIVKKTFSSEEFGINKWQLVAKTPIVEFINDNENNNIITITNALGIKFEDEEQGNYFIYNRARQILTQGDIIRKLTAVFDIEENNVINKNPLLDDYEYIKWIIPAKNTMIIPLAPGDESEKKTVKQIFQEQENKDNNEINLLNHYQIIRNENTYIFLHSKNQTEINNDIPLTSIEYSIEKVLDFNKSNNTIYLEVSKNGQIYTAYVKMLFGTAGTSGSDYTIAVIWDNNENAFDINKGELSGSVHLYDKNNKEINLDTIDGNFQFNWYKIKKSKVENDQNGFQGFDIKLEENENLYYPINNNRLEKLGIGTRNNHSYDILESEYIETDYLINSPTQEEKNTSVEYDLQNNNFTDANYRSTKLLYCKNKRAKKRVLDFQPFDEVKNLNFGGTNNNWFSLNGTGKIEITNEGKRIFYYDNRLKYITQLLSGKNVTSWTHEERMLYVKALKKRKAFIKYKGAYIIDPWDEYQENIIYYEPVYSTEKEYNIEDYILKINYDTNNKGYFTITNKNNEGNLDNNRIVDISQDLYILQITLLNFGDYNLISRIPIPFKNSDNQKNYVVDYINGPSEIRYSTTGEIDINDNSYEIIFKYLNNLNYKIYELDNEYFSAGHWELFFDDTLENLTEQKYFLPKLIETIDSGHLIIDKIYKNDIENNFQNLNKILYVIYNELNSNENKIKQLVTKINNNIIDLTNLTNIIAADNYINALKIFKDEINTASNEDINIFKNQLKNAYFINSIDYFIKPKLAVPDIYFSNLPLCGIKFIVDKDIDNNGNIIINKNTVLWSQPIYFYQDNYPSTTLNSWNGKALEVQEEKGFILSKGFSAGKKESDNSFTGVIIGDWSNDISDTMFSASKQTGIYGFNKGAMSYALKDDGTAFFGKEGTGRIYFNGNNAKIYSSQWDKISSSTNIETFENNNYDLLVKSHNGLMLDLDDGLIKINQVAENISYNNSTYAILPLSTMTFGPGLLKATCISDLNSSQVNIINFNVGNIGEGLIYENIQFLLQSPQYAFGNNVRQTGLQIDFVKNQICGYGATLKFGIETNEDVYKDENLILNGGSYNSGNGLSNNNPIIIGKNLNNYQFAVSYQGNLVTNGNIITHKNLDAESIGYITPVPNIYCNNIRVTNGIVIKSGDVYYNIYPSIRSGSIESWNCSLLNE